MTEFSQIQTSNHRSRKLKEHQTGFKKKMPKYIFKLHKIKHKEKILKEARVEKYLSYRGEKIRITLTYQKLSRKWSEIFKMLRVKTPTKLEFCTL